PRDGAAGPGAGAGRRGRGAAAGRGRRAGDRHSEYLTWMVSITVLTAAITTSSDGCLRIAYPSPSYDDALGWPTPGSFASTTSSPTFFWASSTPSTAVTCPEPAPRRYAIATAYLRS